MPRPRHCILLSALLVALLTGASALASSAQPAAPLLTLAQAEVVDDIEEVEDDIEDELEDEIEDRAQEAAEEEAEERAEDAAEEQAEEQAEERAGEVAEDAAEDAMEDSLEDEAGERAEEIAEEAAEDALEDSLSDEAEDRAQEIAQQAVEDALEEGMDEAAEERAQAIAEAAVEEALEDRLEEEAGGRGRDIAREAAEQALEDRMGEEAEGRGPDVEQVRGGRDGAQRQAATEHLRDRVSEELENLIELDGELVVSRELLVLAEPEQLEQLRGHPALSPGERTVMSALGLSLGRFQIDGDVDPAELRERLQREHPGLSLDFNHGYRLNRGESTEKEESALPLSAYYRPHDNTDAAIGLLDGPVDTDHPALTGASITSRAFAPEPTERERRHGTAVASLLVSQSQQMPGLVPGARLYAASVFSDRAQHGTIATTTSLISALDWLAGESVTLVNISLSGPANRTLEAALGRVRERGIVPVAAVGNAGPLADPQFPAAYPSVLAITAVDRKHAVYRYAVRGEHLDFAAPGVKLLAAGTDGGAQPVTGTSFAAPVVTGLLAARLAEFDNPEAALKSLAGDTLDLGEPGADPVYGQGLAGHSRLLTAE